MTTALPDIDYGRSLLLTDLYQLNMLEAYASAGMRGTAVFEFFVRRLPASRGFLMAAGLEQVVGFLLEARVSEREIAWLRESGRFSEELIAYLAGFHFTGDLEALPEGTLVFADEPLIRITAPIAEAQLVETRLVNFLQYQTLVASKAARMVLAAPGRSLVDFGLRRAHSGEAGLLAARAAYLAGFAGTASVPAGQHFGIPLYGTMAHSYIQAFESEAEAFLAFARARPDQTVFLLDTYDTERAAATVARIAPTLAAEGIVTRGVRLDSGDLGAHARKVRAILDGAGLGEVQIVASGGLDEDELAALTARDAPIDVYGIGTSLVTSEDLPGLDCAYKLKAYDGSPRRKRSEKKAYWPGPTQVHRRLDAAGRLAGDRLTRAEETAEGEALLRPVMRAGSLIAPLPSLGEVREHSAQELSRLPESLTRLEGPSRYEAVVSEALRDLAAAVDRAVGR
ncbi:MAG: nicotinate phosphoribosyltransferase [Tistlia sp.]|uniref:nicotinate phosphoribosyltransferase n=1 Tax=Tistlia sp. TaxID=3057121 RepID=UPI0034A16750